MFIIFALSAILNNDHTYVVMCVIKFRMVKFNIFFNLFLCLHLCFSQFLDHDDRDRKLGGGDLTIRKDINRRVSFKTSGNQGRQNKLKSRAVEMGVRGHVEEDDDMADYERPGYRNSDRTRRRGSPIPRNSKKIIEGASGWFQILVSKKFASKSALIYTAF